MAVVCWTEQNKEQNQKLRFKVVMKVKGPDEGAISIPHLCWIQEGKLVPSGERGEWADFGFGFAGPDSLGYGTSTWQPDTLNTNKREETF
jgi:hypothetical protein